MRSDENARFHRDDRHAIRRAAPEEDEVVAKERDHPGDIEAGEEAVTEVPSRAASGGDREPGSRLAVDARCAAARDVPRAGLEGAVQAHAHP